MLGDSNVGKSTLVTSYRNNSFNPHMTQTIGFETHSAVLNVNDTAAHVQIWDTAGQERFAGINTCFYRNTSAAMIVYDITNKSSFDHLTKWLDELRAFSRSGVLNVLLVGNKTDMDVQRQVSYEQAAAYAAKNEMAFMETSCVTLSNVHEAFQSLVSRTVEQMLAKYQQSCPPPSSVSVLASCSANDDSHPPEADLSCSSC